MAHTIEEVEIEEEEMEEPVRIEQNPSSGSALPVPNDAAPAAHRASDLIHIGWDGSASITDLRAYFQSARVEEHLEFLTRLRKELAKESK